jgi:hypothetical protein
MGIYTFRSEKIIKFKNMTDEENQLSNLNFPNRPGNSNVILSKTSQPKSSGPNSSGPNSSGPKSSGAKSSGPKSSGAKSSGDKSSGPKSSEPKSSGTKSSKNKSSFSATENAFFRLPIWAQLIIKILVFFLALTGLTCGILTCKAKNKYRLNSMIAGVILM